jgi:hypothetical protein
VAAVSSCCPDHDPLLRATSLACNSCGRKSYPVTADWLTGTLILATFDQDHERGCTNRNGCGTVLIDTTAEGETFQTPQRPRLCRAIATATGQPCRAVAQAGSGYCYNHNRARRATS